MGKLHMFAITLHGDQNTTPVFYSGQTISGVVTVDLSEPMKMRGIHVHCKGEGKVHWTERHTRGSGDNRRTVTEHYRNYECYMKMDIILFGKPQGQMSGDNPVLPQGYYQYPFSFLLPPGLPSSFEGAHGRVRYSISANIDKPWKIDHETIRPFTVIFPLDLNQLPACRVGVDGSDEKMICCLCCASGPIVAQFWLPRSGFVPGEWIFINAALKNNSSRDIDSCRFTLSQEVVFISTRKSRHRSMTIIDLRTEGLQPYENRDFSDIKMQVPPLPPSDLPGCNIINVYYQIKMIADPSGPATDLVVRLPITIGTIPLADSYQFYMQQMGPSINMPTPAVDPSAPPMPMPELPPPSYAELFDKNMVVVDNEDNEDAKETNLYGPPDWTPHYTYYTYPDPSAPTM